MAKEEKAKIHRWIRLGVQVITTNNQFTNDFIEYARRVKDPSLLAMTKDEADCLLESRIWPPDVAAMLAERIRISERQGAFSLQRKRELQEIRTAT